MGPSSQRKKESEEGKGRREIKTVERNVTESVNPIMSEQGIETSKTSTGSGRIMHHRDTLYARASSGADRSWGRERPPPPLPPRWLRWLPSPPAPADSPPPSVS